MFRKEREDCENEVEWTGKFEVNNWIYGPVSHSGRTYTVKIQDARSTLFSRLELYTQVKLRILVLKQTQHKWTGIS